MTKNKIIINATCDGEKPTGVGVFNRELTKRLIEIDPDLFTPYLTVDFLPDMVHKKVYSLSLSTSAGSKGQFLRWLWTQTLLNFSGCKFIFSTVPEGPLLLQNKAMVIHDILALKYPEYYPRQKYYYKYFMPLLLRTSKILFFDSESAKKDVYDYYKLKNKPFKVIYPGYETAIFSPKEKGYIQSKYGLSNYFLFVGEMRPYKNIMNAIHAFQKSELRNVKFVIAGKKESRFFPEIQELVTDLEMQDRIIFMDYVPKEDLPYLYSDALALVFPSEYEGFGLPPLEAMATGTPVITTRLTSIPEVCGDAALYINPKSVDEISSAMQTITDNENLRNELSQKSLDRSKLFSWDKCAKEYYQTLKELI